MSAPNGSIYSIPYSARRVIKFDPVSKFMTYIGLDFGDDGCKWTGMAITDSGIIYCVPCNSDCAILKVDTNADTATELNRNLLPEQGSNIWISCAVALDGCIYCMPNKAREDRSE